MPSSVVRSTIPMARSMARRLESVLIERVPRDAARCSAPTWSTPGRPWRNLRSEDSLAVSWANIADPDEGAVAFKVVTLASLG